MLLHDDGLPGSWLCPVWREGPHGGQRRAPHRPVKGPWRSWVRPRRTAFCLPWPGQDPADVRAARHPAPPMPLYPSGEKTQEPREGQVHMGGTRRGSTVVHGLASRRCAAGCRGTRCMRGDLGCLVRGERRAPGGATRNGPWCAREGSTQRCQRRSSCLVPWTWRASSQRPMRHWCSWTRDDRRGEASGRIAKHNAQNCHSVTMQRLH
jgi:hypothetical protein